MNVETVAGQPGPGEPASTDVRWGSVVIRGAAWVGTSRFLGQFVQLLVGVVLARALTPADFGLAATVFIFMGVAGLLNDAGLATALVHKPSLEAEDLSTTFWVNFVLGVLMAGLLSAFAPVLASLYHQPLRELTWVVASAFALNLSVVPAALLERALRYRALATCDFVASAAGVVGSLVALALGAGVFSLAVPPAINAVVRSAMVMWIARWRPTFTIHRASLAYLWSFSGFFTLGSLVNHVQTNFAGFLIGWRVGPWELGLFTRGQSLAGVPAEHVPAVAGSAAIPALASLHRQGRDLTEPYVRAHAATVTVAGLVLGYLALTADFLVPFVYGDRWTGSVEILRYLCLAGLCAVVSGPSLWIFYIIQRTDLLFHWRLVMAVASMSAAVVGCHWQAVGTAKGLAVAGLALIVPTFVYGGRFGKIPVSATLRVLAPGAILATAASASSLGMRLLVQEAGASGIATFAAESGTFAVVVAGSVYGMALRGILIPGSENIMKRLGVRVPRDHPGSAVRPQHAAGEATSAM